jgi:hypothetical protein
LVARWVNDNRPATAALPIPVGVKEVVGRNLVAVVELRRNPVPGDVLLDETLALFMALPPELVIVPAAAFLDRQGSIFPSTMRKKLAKSENLLPVSVSWPDWAGYDQRGQISGSLGCPSEARLLHSLYRNSGSDPLMRRRLFSYR